MKIIILVACDMEGGIGHKGGIPWNIKADMKHFKNMTTGKTILMGRKTFESIGKPLPNRNTIVLSKDDAWREQMASKFPQLSLYSDLKLAIRHAQLKQLDQIIICGGAGIYNEMFDKADEVYCTWVDGTYETDTKIRLDWVKQFDLVDKHIHYGSRTKSPRCSIMHYLKKQ